jgi:hypothetical protein
VQFWGKQWTKCVLRDCDDRNWPLPEDRRKYDCLLPPTVVVTVKDRRYLGLAKDKTYLVCRYQTKPTIRFFKCWAWEGE